jgi:hypothetical protein
MPEFLVELYVPRTEDAALKRGAAKARRAAQRLTREGTPVRYLRSIFVPDDEICFHLYEAETAEVVREAVRRAQLSFERVTAVTLKGA